MGAVDEIVIKCRGCGKETSSQTKIIGVNEFLTFKIGNKIIDDEFANCILKLKSDCKCGCGNAIVIKNRKIIEVVEPKYATCIERSFGDYEWVAELEQAVIEKLRKIEDGKT